MSNQPVRAWQALLQHLSDLKASYNGTADSLQDCQPINEAFRSVGMLPAPMPRAVLKKLVWEQQVRFGPPKPHSSFWSSKGLYHVAHSMASTWSPVCARKTGRIGWQACATLGALTCTPVHFLSCLVSTFISLGHQKTAPKLQPDSALSSLASRESVCFISPWSCHMHLDSPAATVSIAAIPFLLPLLSRHMPTDSRAPCGCCKCPSSKHHSRLCQLPAQHVLSGPPVPPHYCRGGRTLGHSLQQQQQQPGSRLQAAALRGRATQVRCDVYDGHSRAAASSGHLLQGAAAACPRLQSGLPTGSNLGWAPARAGTEQQEGWQ